MGIQSGKKQMHKQVNGINTKADLQTLRGTEKVVRTSKGWGGEVCQRAGDLGWVLRLK